MDDFVKDTNVPNNDCISRQAAIEAVIDADYKDCGVLVERRCRKFEEALRSLPAAQPDGYVKIPETGIDDLSDGFHTFRQLYYQRMMLFATIVKQNKNKAWKSLRHEDGEFCFGGGWFIVGVDTPEGSYTYHYEDNFYSLFDCEELERGKHWDGHTEKDVTRLLSLPSAQPEVIRCIDCIHYTPLGIDKSWGRCAIHSSPTENQRMCQSCDFCAWAERREDG